MHSVILKNDAVGDLVHSLSSINNVTSAKVNNKVTIFLSERSKKFGTRTFKPMPPLVASRRGYSPDAGCLKKVAPYAACK